MANPVTSHTFDSVVIKPRYRKSEPTVLADLEVIDITDKVVGINYFETLLSPVLTATITIANPEARIRLFDDIVIRGGEDIEFTIKDSVSKNDDNAGLTKIKMTVDKPLEQTNANLEFIILKCTSAWRETLESQKKVKGIQQGNPSNIANEIYKTNFNKPIKYLDQAVGNISVNFGEEKKDDTLPSIMLTAFKSSTEKNAGFFFYETKFGHHYKSVDNIVTGEGPGPELPIYEYNSNGVNPGIEGDSSMNILYLQSESTSSISRQAARITGNVNYVVADPIRYDGFTQNNVQINDYEFKRSNTETLIDIDVSALQNPTVNGRSEFLGILNMNEFNPCNGYYENLFKTKLPAKLRYSAFFAQRVTMTVPVNTSLIAGAKVKLSILRKVFRQDCSYEDDLKEHDISGLYNVAAVCHAFDRSKAYSSVLLTRDEEKRN